MPAIGDQVASLEHDYTAALARIDSLLAENAAIKAAHAAVTADNAALNKYADEIKAMVENVASGALKMLQAARAPIVAAVETALKTVEADVEKAAASLDARSAGIFAATIGLVTGDSGDETKTELVLDHDRKTVTVTDLDGRPLPMAVVEDARLSPDFSGASPFASLGQAINKEAAVIEAKLAGVPEAVERMLHHSSGASTTIRRPVDMTMHVEHTDEGLPMFLRRGTAFDVMARERIFG